MKRILTAILCVTLAAQSAFGLGGGGAILCVGTDGHLRIEAWEASCCDRAPSDDSRRASGTWPPSVLAADGTCGPCADIPVGSAETLTPTRTSRAGLVSDRDEPGCAECGPVTSTAVVPDRSYLPLPTPVPPASMPAIRSTILQI